MRDPGLVERVRVGGLLMDAVTPDQAIGTIITAIQRGHGGTVITPNLEHVRMVRRDPSLNALYEAATLVVADGMPVLWAARIRGTPLPARVAGSDLIFSVSAAAAREGLRCFYLGGNPGAADGAAAELLRRYPSLNVVGTLAPVHGFDADPSQLQTVMDTLTEAQPDIVFVGLGFPKQERFAEMARQHLPRTWFLGIGISLSFASGEVARAPSWMQRAGLEWCHRMVQEPGRLVRRYVFHGLPFAAKLMFESAVERVSRRRGDDVGAAP